MLTMLYGRLSGVILVSIVQNKDKEPFFPFLCGVTSSYTNLMQNMNAYMITVHL